MPFLTEMYHSPRKDEKNVEMTIQNLVISR